MGPQSRRLAILSFGVTILAIGLECATAEECDYTTCGELMARDGSASWANDYSPDTKRACAELNACVRRAKNNSAGRAVVPPAAGSGTLKSNPKGPATALKPEVDGKQSEGTQPASTGAPYPYPVSPPRYQRLYRDSEPYEDPYDRLYAPRPPRVVYHHRPPIPIRRVRLPIRAAFPESFRHRRALRSLLCRQNISRSQRPKSHRRSSIAPLSITRQSSRPAPSLSIHRTPTST